MFGKDKSAVQVEAPNGWTDAMLRDFLDRRPGPNGTMNVLLMIYEAQKQFELYRGSHEVQVSFVACIVAKEGSQLEFARADIRFSDLTYGRAANVPSDAIGYLCFSDSVSVDGGPQLPLLEVTLFGSAEGQSSLERCLVDARQFGADFVPLWIWVMDIESAPRTAAGAIEFCVNNQLAVSKCHWQQILNLGDQVPQDRFLSP